MQNSSAVGTGEGVRDADQQFDTLPPAGFCIFYPLPKRAAIDEFADQLLAPIELANIMHGNDVRMIERRRHLRFLLEAASARLVSEIGRQKFDSHRPVQPRVPGAVNFAHPTRSDLRLNLVRSEMLACKQS